jgi:Ca2+:H+ antiporter
LVAGILVACVLAAVHHAELIAHKLGEPFGTFVLALAVTIIELGLILTLMAAAQEGAATLARDTVFAAVMIILNGLVGLCLMIGGISHREQPFQQTGVSASLATLSALTALTLVLPNFTISEPGPVYSPSQLGFVAVVSFLLYATFVVVQTVRHRDYFLPEAALASDPEIHAAPLRGEQPFSPRFC